MNFPKWLAPERDLMSLIRESVLMPRNPPHRHLADDLGPLLCFLIDDDLITSMNLIVWQNAILKHKPTWAPTFAVVHPLVEYTTDTVPNNIIDLDINRRLPGRGMSSNHLSSKNTSLAKTSSIAITKTPIMAMIGNSNRRIRSGGNRESRRGRGNMEVRHRIRRLFRRGVVRDSRDAAERMHRELKRKKKKKNQREGSEDEEDRKKEMAAEVKVTSWDSGGGFIDPIRWKKIIETKIAGRRRFGLIHLFIRKPQTTNRRPWIEREEEFRKEKSNAKSSAETDFNYRMKRNWWRRKEIEKEKENLMCTLKMEMKIGEIREEANRRRRRRRY